MKIKLNSFKSWRSIRTFLDRQVCDDVVKDLISSGRDKLDYMGEKLLSFTIIQDKEKIEKLNNVTKLGMMKKSSVDIIKRLGKTPDFDMFYGAPTVIMISVKKRSKVIGDIIADVVHKIITKAKDLGLATNWNSFVKYHFTDEMSAEDKLQLDIPEDYTPHYVISVGYPN